MAIKYFLNRFLWSNKPINRYSGRKRNPEILLNCSVNKTQESVIMDNISNNGMIQLKDITDLSQLDNYVKKTAPELLNYKSRTSVVGEGPGNAKLLVIGEAPGEEEDLQGRPFVGKSGILLRKMIKYANIDEEKIYISNVVPCRPEDNRTPTPEEISQCLPMIEKRISVINPVVILLVGGTAAKSILKTNVPVTKLRGIIYDVVIEGKIFKAIVTFHPSFLLRSPGYKADAKEDMDFLTTFLREIGIMEEISLRRDS